MLFIIRFAKSDPGSVPRTVYADDICPCASLPGAIIFYLIFVILFTIIFFFCIAGLDSDKVSTS